MNFRKGQLVQTNDGVMMVVEVWSFYGRTMLDLVFCGENGWDETWQNPLAYSADEVVPIFDVA
jgi:hypothetical protein